MLTNLVIIVAIFVLTSLGTLFLLQKYFSSYLFKDHTDFASSFSDAIGIVFGLTLAFITISTWQSYNDVKSSVSKEAFSLNSIYRTLDAYPPEIRNHGKELLQLYVDGVITKDWPLMAEDKYDMPTYEIFNQFHKLLLNYVPNNDGELVAQQEELRAISEYRMLRLNRVLSSKSSLDSPMILALTLSAFLYLFYQCLYSMPNRKHHKTMIFLLSGSLGIIFYLIYEYITPFSGSNAIRPEEFIGVLQNWRI